jgi:hypothetical protein
MKTLKTNWVSFAQAKLKATRRVAIIAIALIAVFILSFASCGDGGDSGGGNVAVTGVSLNKTTLSLNVTETETLAAVISPSNATNKKVAWNTSNPAVATVLPNGFVSGISFGTAVISVTTDDGSITATCAVTVSAPVTPAEVSSLLAALPANTIDTPHTISVIVSADGDVDEQFSVIKAALRGASNKYVYLDFSKSDMRSVPYMAFSTEVGEDEFIGCNTLIGVNIPSTVTEISFHAFRSCENLASINIPNSVTSILDSSFHDCKSLASITLPNGITRIEGFVFQGCTSLASMNIPNTVTQINWRAFQDCTSLTSLTLPNSVTTILVCAFMSSGLTSITIPDSVTEMDGWVFVNCEKLASINIGKGLTKIEEGVFGWCFSYSSITIPSNIKSIGYESFAGTNLTSVTFQGTIPAGDFHPDAFKYQGSDLREKYLAGGIGTYTRADGEDENATWTKQ